MEKSKDMEFKIFNSMTKEKEVFTPKEEGKVGMYVCGVTPYDFSHIGHARAYVAFDVLHRFLKYLGYEVKYVRNFTDIDDKIIKRANEAGEKPVDLSRRFSEEFQFDVAQLQCLPPTDEPRVSEHMKEIISIITKITENGYAYELDGDVYFSVDKFPKYGCLSRRKLDDNRAGGGGRVTVDSRKRNPADFALWKSAKPDEPWWESPWSRGRPGWHIECSAMSLHYLGQEFDIHGGGMDLTFPHHENEIAQSHAAHPDEFRVRYWMHNGFVNKDNQKMSKSDNNFFTIRDIIISYHPLALRFFLMRTHYRSDVNYSDRLLDTASDRIFKIFQALHDCEVALSPFCNVSSKAKVSSKAQNLVEEFHKEFLGAMCDDLHTTIVLDKLMNLVNAINGTLKNFKSKQQQQKLFQDLIAYENEVKDVLGVLGLMPSSTSSEVYNYYNLNPPPVTYSSGKSEKVGSCNVDSTVKNGSFSVNPPAISGLLNIYNSFPQDYMKRIGKMDISWRLRRRKVSVLILQGGIGRVATMQSRKIQNEDGRGGLLGNFVSRGHIFFSYGFCAARCSKKCFTQGQFSILQCVDFWICYLKV